MLAETTGGTRLLAMEDSSPLPLSVGARDVASAGCKKDSGCEEKDGPRYLPRPWMRTTKRTRFSSPPPLSSSMTVSRPTGFVDDHRGITNGYVSHIVCSRLVLFFYSTSDNSGNNGSRVVCMRVCMEDPELVRRWLCCAPARHELVVLH